MTTRTGLSRPQWADLAACKAGKYTETVEFFHPESMRTYLGKKQEFTVRVEGDKLHQSGKLSDGMNIEEVWQQVKPAQE